MFRLALKSQFLLFILVMGFGQSPVAAKKQQVSLEEASELIRHSTQGKILSARTTSKDNLKSHRIQVLTPSGRIKVYQVPANNNQNNQNNKNNNHRDNRQGSNYLINPNQRNNSRSSHNRNSSSHNNRSNSNTNNRQKNQTRTSTSKRSKGEAKQK